MLRQPVHTEQGFLCPDWLIDFSISQSFAQKILTVPFSINYLWIIVARLDASPAPQYLVLIASQSLEDKGPKILYHPSINLNFCYELHKDGLLFNNVCSKQKYAGWGKRVYLPERCEKRVFKRKCLLPHL
jgi:hypothetical protein